MNHGEDGERRRQQGRHGRRLPGASVASAAVVADQFHLSHVGEGHQRRRQRQRQHRRRCGARAFAPEGCEEQIGGLDDAENAVQGRRSKPTPKRRPDYPHFRDVRPALGRHR